MLMSNLDFEYQEESLYIYPMRFKRGKTYPLHDHPNMLVMAIVLEGRPLIKCYNIAQELGDNKFKLEKTVDKIASPGDFIFLSHDYNNLHTISFPNEKGLILDVIMNDYDDMEREFGVFTEIDHQNSIFKKEIRLVKEVRASVKADSLD